MTGATNLLESERGVACIFLLLVVTALVVLGKVTGAQWLTYTQFIIGFLVASKTITGVVETMKSKPTDQASPTASPPTA